MRGVYAPSCVGRNQPFFKADRNAPYWQTFLWEVVDCHFTLPFVSRVGFSQPYFYLRCWLTSATIRKWQLPIALQGDVLETHHDEHPMKHRSWSDVITKEMVALVKNKKSPMPPKPYEGRSDLTLWDKATQFPPAMPDSFAQGLHQRVPVTIVSLMQH